MKGNRDEGERTNLEVGASVLHQQLVGVRLVLAVSDVHRELLRLLERRTHHMTTPTRTRRYAPDNDT